MLSAADKALAARDPRVPGLATVLDPEAVLALVVRRVNGPELLDACPTYVRYKPGTSCVVGYELTTAAGPVLAYAKAHAPATAAKLRKAHQKEVRDERLGVGVITHADDAVLVAAAMSDRDLPALRALGHPARGERLLRALLPGHPDLWTQRLRPLRHKPERRWVGVVERHGQPVAMIKALRPADFEHTRSRLRQLAAPAGRPLGWSRRRAAVAASWIEGRSLADVLDADGPVDIAAVAQAVAALHARRPASLAEGGHRAVAGTVAPAAEAVAALLPALAPRAWHLAAVLGPQLNRPSMHDGIIHGDFSADQVVLTASGAELIDFDQAQVGEPTADLASFSARLLRAEIEGRLGPGRARSVFDDLLGAYRRAGGAPVGDRLAVHQAAALLRLVVAPFRERHADWPAVGEALLRAAEQHVSPSTSGPRRSR